MSNLVKTTLLLALLTGLFIAVGGPVGGRSGMIMAFLLALVMNFVSYWFSDKIVLKMYGAQPIEENQAARRAADRPGTGHAIRHPDAEALRHSVGLPERLRRPGAVPQHAAVAVTEGILRIMNETELEGVLAHELSHVLNRDMLISTVAATVAGAISMIANIARWGLMFGGGSRDDDEGAART